MLSYLRGVGSQLLAFETYWESVEIWLKSSGRRELVGLDGLLKSTDCGGWESDTSEHDYTRRG